MEKRYDLKIEDITKNYEQLKKDFKWELDLSKHLVALNYVIQDKEVDSEYIKAFNKEIKERTGMFSPFRGNMQFAIAGLLTAEYDDPSSQLETMLRYQDTLKSVGFKQSTYLPTALYALLKCDEMSPNMLAERAKGVYDDMKKNHPFLTSGDDYALAILLANSGRDPQVLERYYSAMSSEGFSKANGLQMLSHILSFSERDVQSTVKRCVQIKRTLKENKLNITSDYYPAIGLMTLLDDENDELLNALVETSNTLRSQKGYKWLGKGMNVMIASALIASEYVKEKETSLMTTSLQVSIQSIIAAQQAAMIAAVSASTAVAASS
ncbi:DUF4003 domain-containing protein [Acidaminobacter sp. JC074]|uniref:DUF4003 family protein n=1 Tax=Acidaminobacter sp. JC074 TaxID=2530199 RepID=UPI001F0E30ED|nr:DUF4003 family protein [Acidaminobacter sp. JC074]MCH4886576.1 DUF4003 domain-containing protein [Acidaminobacter sp. JC074]